MNYSVKPEAIRLRIRSVLVSIIVLYFLSLFSGCADFWTGPFQKGVHYYQQGKLNQALLEFKKVATYAPGSPLVHVNIAKIYYHMGALDQAIHESKVAIQLSTANQVDSSFWAYYVLGKCYMVMGRYDEAIQQFKKASALNFPYKRELSLPYWELSQIYEFKGQYEKAIDSLKFYKTLNPEESHYADAYIAHCYAQLGNPRATDLYNNLILKTQTKGHLGIWLRQEDGGIKVVSFRTLSSAKAAGIKEGDFILKWRNKSVDKLEELVKLVVESQIGDTVTVTIKRGSDVLEIPVVVRSEADIYKSELAWFYCRTGELKKAKEICESLIKVYPDSRDINLTLSRIYYEKGLYDKSEKFHGWGFIGVGLFPYEFYTHKEIRISEVCANSPAQQAGLKPGDRVLRIDGRGFSNVDDIIRYISRKPVGAKIAVMVERNEQTLTIPVKVTNRFEWLRKYELGGLRRYMTCVIDFDTTVLPARRTHRLSGLLRDELSKTKCYNVLTEEAIKQIVKHRQIDLTKYVNLRDDRIVSQLGKELNAEKMVRGSIIKSEGFYVITVAVIDVETGQVEITRTKDCVSEASLEETILKLAHELCRR